MNASTDLLKWANADSTVTGGSIQAGDTVTLIGRVTIPAADGGGLFQYVRNNATGATGYARPEFLDVGWIEDDTGVKFLDATI